MIITTMYPRKLNINDYRLKSELISSVIYHNKEKIKDCDIILHYSKRLSKNGNIYKMHYYSDDELLQIYQNLLKHLLPNIHAHSWIVCEKHPLSFPEVQLHIKQLS